jgi:molybdate transport system substrate-binding protein
MTSSLLSRLGRVLAAGSLAAVALLAEAGEVTVAAAANFAQPLQRLVQRFEAASGHRVAVSVGSTGKLYSQIVAGAPFDLLLAADPDRPERLEREGLAEPGSRFTYAVGQLVLWSPRPGLVDDQGAVLASDRFQRLALANPRLAPYGEAAMAVLRQRGLAERLAPRLVTGDSIAQAYQFVATGNTEIGFVARSQLQAPGRPVSGSVWLVPQALYPAIRQDAVLLRRGAHNPAAKALLAYLRSREARDLIAAHGYGLPD